MHDSRRQANTILGHPNTTNESRPTRSRQSQCESADKAHFPPPAIPMRPAKLAKRCSRKYGWPGAFHPDVTRSKCSKPRLVVPIPSRKKKKTGIAPFHGELREAALDFEMNTIYMRLSRQVCFNNAPLLVPPHALLLHHPFGEMIKIANSIPFSRLCDFLSGSGNGPRFLFFI